jgi:hypothetical protein
MKDAKFKDFLSMEDFLWYYISQIESGHEDLSEAIIGYERDYIKNARSFNFRGE